MNAPDRARAGFGQRGEFLVAIQFALMLGFALLPVWHPGLNAADLAHWLPWRIGIAAPLALIAVLFAGFGAHDLGASLTPLPYPTEYNRLVRHGVYALVRHPLYASLLFAGLAWTIIVLSLSHALLLALAFWFFDYKAGKEEHWLTQRYPEYPDYARTVRKFIPWVY